MDKKAIALNQTSSNYRRGMNLFYKIVIFKLNEK